MPNQLTLHRTYLLPNITCLRRKSVYGVATSSAYEGQATSVVLIQVLEELLNESV